MLGCWFPFILLVVPGLYIPRAIRYLRYIACQSGKLRHIRDAGKSFRLFSHRIIR